MFAAADTVNVWFAVPVSSFRDLLDKMAALDLPAQLDLEASPETSASLDPKESLYVRKSRTQRIEE